ncbi:MAG: FkbM family methyltransferase [Flavobacteriales bacterium]|nr:FkbM family methyltransferase [Flavobacteriales bacterium]
MNFVNKFLSLLGVKLIRAEYHNKSNKIVTTIIGGVELLINKGSMLPAFLKHSPHYESTLPRLTKFISENNSDFDIIDAGAYIGDTAALIRQQVENKIYSIEGDIFFYELLKKNAVNIPNMIPVKAYLGSGASEQLKNHMNQLADSTNPYKKSENDNQTIESITLDSLVENKTISNNIGLLKIDTDGYDFEVIRGANKLLKEVSPILYIEFDRKLLENQNFNGLEELIKLKTSYGPVMVYDNFGHLLLSTDMDDTKILGQLYNYMSNEKSPIYYFDLIIFPKNKADLFQTFNKNEINYFENFG